MRAAAWATNRDITAARLSWERAQKIADALPAEDPARAAMRIAPRTMLCANAWRVHMNVAGDRFEELRELCTAAGDKASLAIGMAGLVADYTYQDRIRDASQLASEAWVLAESVGDATLTVGLSFALFYAKAESGEWSDVLRWSHDLHRAVAMARSADSLSYTTVVTFVYVMGIPTGVLTSDDRAVREIEDALRIAERSADDPALAVDRMTLGVALVHRPTDFERDRGQKLLAEVSDVFLRGGYILGDLPLVNVYLAREWFRRGDRDEAIPLMRATVDHLFREGQLLMWGVLATGVLVETLLDRGADVDVAEAEAAVERLAAAPADEGLVMREIWLLRLRALLARAHGDAAAYADLRDRYRDMAKTLGFEGHIAWAEAMA
jgi:hypothetical protein